MARYSTSHSAESRRRIIASAGRRFKAGGVAATGIAAVMSDAGLTNGALPKHFVSKDALVAAVVTDQLERQRASIAALPEDLVALEGFIRTYLSAAERDATGDGCPSAALLPEVARGVDSVRAAYQAGIQTIVAEIARRLRSAGDVDAEHRALGLLGELIGTLQLARAVPDPAFSSAILDAGIERAIALVRLP